MCTRWKWRRKNTTGRRLEEQRPPRRPIPYGDTLIAAVCGCMRVCDTVGGVCMSYHTVYLWWLPVVSHTQTEEQGKKRSGTFCSSLPPVTFLPHHWRLSDERTCHMVGGHFHDIWSPRDSVMTHLYTSIKRQTKHSFFPGNAAAVCSVCLRIALNGKGPWIQ